MCSMKSFTIYVTPHQFFQQRWKHAFNRFHKFPIKSETSNLYDLWFRTKWRSNIFCKATLIMAVVLLSSLIEVIRLPQNILPQNICVLEKKYFEKFNCLKLNLKIWYRGVSNKILLTFSFLFSSTNLSFSGLRWVKSLCKIFSFMYNFFIRPLNYNAYYNYTDPCSIYYF